MIAIRTPHDARIEQFRPDGRGYRNLVLALLLVGLTASCCTPKAVPRVVATDEAALIFEGDFESDERGIDRLGTAGLEQALGRTRLVTSPARGGEFALEVNLDRAAGDHRTDFYIRNIGGRFKVGREYWYGFSVWFSEDWTPDTQNELFVQWVRTTKNPAGPQLAIYINGEDYVIRKRWDPKPADAKQEVEHANLWRASVLEDRGKWVDWVFHVMWSKDESGLVEVWRNRQPVLRDTGPNCYNDGDDKAPYFKFGLYKWPWQKTVDEAPSVVSSRRLYFDEIRIGDATANLESVSSP